MDIAAIRAGLAAAAATISGLHSYAVEPEQLESPAVVFTPAEPYIRYNEALNGGLVQLDFDAIILVSTANGLDRAAAAVDILLSAGTGATGSLVDALNAAGTLGGAAEHVVVDKADRMGLVDIKGGGSYTVGRLSLTVRAKRT